MTRLENVAKCSLGDNDKGNKSLHTLHVTPYLGSYHETQETTLLIPRGPLSHPS